MPRRINPLPHLSPEPEINDSRSSPFIRIAISFTIAVAAIVCLILYYTLQEAIITIEVAPSNSVTETIVGVSQPGTLGELTGAITQIELSDTQTFTASPAGDKEDKASGTVTLISKNNAPQTLIATTRLSSPQGILFRLKKTVTVPAGGKVDVPVVADQPGEGSAVGPTTFTIPGLNASLQKKIYAESTEPMRRADKPGNKITVADLERARKTMSEALTPQAIAKLREQLPEDQKKWSVVYKSEEIDPKSSLPAGTISTNFTYTIKVKVMAVFYDSTTLRERILSKLQSDTTAGRKILTLEEQSLTVEISNISSDLKSAELKAKVMAQTVITDPELAISKVDLTGRTPEDIQQYFTGIPGIKNATLELSPFWVKAVPTAESHITIQLKQ